MRDRHLGGRSPSSERARTSALPWKASSGLPRASRPTSMSRKARPRQPRPSAFIAASLAAKRPATCSAKARGWRRARLISPVAEDAGEEALAVALENALDAVDLRQVEPEQQADGQRASGEALEAEEPRDLAAERFGLVRPPARRAGCRADRPCRAAARG